MAEISAGQVLDVEVWCFVASPKRKRRTRLGSSRFDKPEAREKDKKHFHLDFRLVGNRCSIPDNVDYDGEGVIFDGAEPEFGAQ